LITFVWFVGAMTTLLRRAEGAAPWRSAIAMGSGVLFVALVLSGNEVAAAFHADDLDPQIARYAFDEGQAAFANARVALGSFAGCCGWVIASTRFLPRWVGWLAIASGVGLALSRISWTSKHLAAALPDVLAVGDHGGRAAPAPQTSAASPSPVEPCAVLVHISPGLPSQT